MSTSRIESVDYAHDIRPYLQLPHLLSLTWLAYPILSLIFVVFRLQLSSTSAQDAVANAKNDLLASCKAAEHAATTAASMPRYLAIATNAQITDAVNGTMNAARATMVLALTIMETIINFVIDIYRSTFLCFIELIVRAVLSLLISAVNEANSLIQDAAGPVADALDAAASAVNDFIDAASKVIKTVSFGSISIPGHIDTSGLNSLRNFTLPSSLTDGLESLNNSLPSVSDLKDKIDSLVDTPFELLKKDINDTFGGLSFDVSALPLPTQNTVTFCDQMDTSVVDDLGRDMVKVVKIGTVIMIILIVLLIAANCALEWYKWRAMKTHFQRIRDGLVADPDVKTQRGPDGRLMVGMSDHDLMSVEGTMSHPLVMKVVNKFELVFKLRKSKKDKLIWFSHYVFHPPAMACFLIGFFGLLSVELQLLAIGPIQAKFEQQTAASVSDFSGVIATSINASMYNQSAAYATQINTRVDTVQSTINDGLFGWVNSTTTTLNDTINTFYTDVQNVVNSVFNNTPLNEPLQEFLRCFLGSKVDAIEDALTFLHDNLHVDVPRVNDTVLVLSPASVNEAAQPIAQAAVGTGNGDDTGLVGRVVEAYVKSLKQERIMFAIFAGLWLFVVFMALCILFWASYGRPMLMRARRRGGGPNDRDRVDALYGGYGSGKHVEAGEKQDLYEVQLADADARDGKATASRGLFWSSMKGPWRRDARSPPQVDGDLSQPRPLMMQNPVYQKSWDNILDNADPSAYEPEGEPSSKVGKSRKLMALGRKGMGREPALKADDDGTLAAFETQNEAAQPAKGNWRKLFGASKKADAAAPVVEDLPYVDEREVTSSAAQQPGGAEYRSRFHEHVSSESLPGQYPPDSP
ncbi:hypothetical protein BD309DRAFT_859454 [Dichomitus squalens]|uniref:Plasma membrane fusion protein PRM1 n=1 Tax=Dichomitus squalens TaxID=114155 RepID=A0A4Q9NVJ5_9APHY|nr:hypothetical protein BD311DRAFT_844916 [Dichomitus squalens]TBU45764.1 hypothetical protein BD309DRAFT_859454 [Dichomitus squalens]